MSGPPVTRLTGDLAQTSVGVTGTQTQILGLVDWEITKKIKKVTCTTTDDAGSEYNLPSTMSWSATAKYAYLDQDPSQLNNILNAIVAGQTPLQWNFFPDAVTGRLAAHGTAFVDGFKLGGGVGKEFALDVTLTGAGPLVFGVQLAPASGVAEE